MPDLSNKAWFVYIIQSQKDGTLYTGITINIEKRLKAHNSNKGAKYTKGRGPFILLKFFEHENKSSAAKMEYQIKQLSKEEKLKLTNEQSN
jgi:putative endonuclease